MRRGIVAALALVGLLACLAGFWGFRRGLRPEAAPTPTPGIATVEFLDVGQGDAILIRSPEGKTALVDAGPSNRVVGLLRDRGIRSIDLVVVSHHHQDHYGGMAAVLRAFHPRAFLDADSPHVTRNYLALLRTVKDQRIMAIRAGPAPRTIELGSVRIRVFPQAPRDERNENNNSVGLLVEYGAFSALLTGDAEGAERRWWSRNARESRAKVDVLKLAHHGARDGTDAGWLALTRPKLAIASLGAGNMFGHPAAEVVAMLGSSGIPLLRTDLAGSIVVRTDGRTFSHDQWTAPSAGGSAPETKEAGEASKPPGRSRTPRRAAPSINTGRPRRPRRR